VQIIRELHDGKEVTRAGLVTVQQARIWDMPEIKPPLIAPAVSVETARRGAAWADGLVTVNRPHAKLRDMLAAYRDAGGRGRAVLQVHVSWAPTEQEAVAVAMDQWRSNVFAPPIPWDLPTVAHIDGVSADVGTGAVHPGLCRARPSPAPRVREPAAGPGGAAVRIETSDPWWKNAVIYCLDPKTFFDDDGDGTGDFGGLIQRVHYLAALGVTCIWLMPFYPTPPRTGTTATTSRTCTAWTGGWETWATSWSSSGPPRTGGCA
jgi:hypothetical protein